jgi:hypothetical protein
MRRYSNTTLGSYGVKSGRFKQQNSSCGAIRSLYFIPPRESGEGGPRVCAVGGASDSTIAFS